MIKDHGIFMYVSHRHDISLARTSNCITFRIICMINDTFKLYVASNVGLKLHKLLRLVHKVINLFSPKSVLHDTLFARL